MEQVLRLAIITNDHFRAEAVGKAVASLRWQLVPAVGAADPKEWLRRRTVDLALVDLDIPGAIALIGELARGVSHVPLLALATPQHLVELQDALLAGAASFVAFPIDTNQFTATVLRTVQSSHSSEKSSPKRGRIVAVAGLRGGVGRTTLAVNLAASLRQRTNQNVILAEAHHTLGDVSLMLNLLPRLTLASLAQESTIDQDVVQGHLQEHSSHVRVLAAPPDLGQLVEMPTETWRVILDLLAQLAPYVIIDTAAVADPVLSEVLLQADDVVVVTGPDLASLRSAVVLLQSLDEEPNVHARSHVVLNRAGVRGGVSEAASRTQIGQKIVAEIPDDPALATFALNRGVPFVLSHPRSILSRRVHDLLQHIFDLSPVKAEKQPIPRLSLSIGHRR